MFQKSNRLAPNIRLVKASVYNTRFFTVKIAKNGQQHNRYGFVISKKIDKRSTVRNKTKRRFRSSMEHFYVQIKQGYDILFFLKKEAVGIPYQILNQALEEILKKGNFLP